MLSIMVSGNNSGALLLTVFGLINLHANEAFTKTRVFERRPGAVTGITKPVEASCIRANGAVTVIAARNAPMQSGTADCVATGFD